jgi:hypothetical protein
MLVNKAKISLVLLTALLLTACGPPNPELAVQEYWQEIISGNTAEAAAYIKTNETTESWLEKLWPENSGEFMDEAKYALYLQRIIITPTGHQINGDKATVDVTVTWPQLDIFFSKFMTEALSRVFSLALTGAEQAEIDQELADIFSSVLAATPDTTTEHTIELILEDGRWKLTSAPLPDPALLFDLQEQD